MNSRMLFSVLSISLSLTSYGQVAEGDRLYAARADGHQGSAARPEPINSAIAAYQRAVSQNPNDLQARSRLMGAIRYKGAYVARTNEEKKQVYTAGKVVAGEALVALERALKAHGITSLMKAGEKELVRAGKRVPHAAEILYWDSVLWGEWALAYGKMAAVRQGAADRIKRSSTLAMMIEPAAESGGGARVLGRLHSETPHVPLITGWASDKLAVKYLRESLAHDTANKVTKVFLAEAMIAADNKSRPQAIKLLQEVLSTPNDREHLVENLSAQDDARALLKKLQ